MKKMHLHEESHVDTKSALIEVMKKVLGNIISLGNLILRDPSGRAHPIVAHTDGAVFENNYFDQRLPIPGDGVPQEQVAQGCTAWPAEKLLAELPALDSRCIIGPDGALTVRNLEIGGGI